MRILPAGVDEGIRFRRVDLDGRPEIEAVIDNLNQTNRSTTLSKGSVKVHTVEHVLATFAGMGVDNAVVELDATEPPIGDGSARIYTQLVDEAGLAPQEAPRRPFRVEQPSELSLEGSLISVFPHDGLKVTCTSSDEQGRFTQYYSVDVTPETWRSEIAHARTFCFFEELEFLIRGGLIRGGSLENAVVIREDAVLTNEPLRYPEEFVRHKILDILGDLSLLGRPLLGHVVAVKPGHRANCEMAKRLLDGARLSEASAHAFTPPPEAAVERPARTVKPSKNVNKRQNDNDEPPEGGGECIDIDEILSVLPHRYPFLMVDRVVEVGEDRLVAIKNVSINEGYFQGHFPQRPVMPGVLQLEAIAQVAGIILYRKTRQFGRIAYFMAADGVKWRKPVRPGDRLRIEVELTKFRGKIGKAQGVCRVDGEVVSEATVTFMVVDG